MNPEALKPSKLASILDQYLRTPTFPLAVRVLKPGEPVPEKAKQLVRDMGAQLAICQGISLSRRYGWMVSMGGNDICCPLALAAFGFRPAVRFFTEGNLAANMYVETCSSAALTEAASPRFEPGECGIILVSPLSRCNFEPQVVLLYGNSAQILRATSASLWKTGGAVTSTTTCRLDCADEIIYPVKTGKQQVILPCMGDRIFAHTQDHEMAFTFPWSMASAVVEGLEGTHRAGLRYPIPDFLRYTPEFPPSYKNLQEIWAAK